MKICKTCKETKDLTKFRMTYNKKVDKHYYRPYCKKCLNKTRNAVRLQKPDYPAKHRENCRKQYLKRKESTPKH